MLIVDIAINKKDPRMRSLKDLKLLGNGAEAAHTKAQLGLGLVREVRINCLNCY